MKKLRQTLNAALLLVAFMVPQLIAAEMVQTPRKTWEDPSTGKAYYHRSVTGKPVSSLKNQPSSLTGREGKILRDLKKLFPPVPLPPELACDGTGSVQFRHDCQRREERKRKKGLNYWY